MRIPRELQGIISNGTSLLVVTGKETAKFYMARDGIMNELEHISVREPKYSDKEGFFERRRGGKVLSSGSVLEPKEKVAINEFLTKLEQKLVDVSRQTAFSRVYVFAPLEHRHRIISAIPYHLKQYIQLVIPGNYVRKSPLGLLLLIKNYTKQPPLILKHVAAEIIKRSQQARKVIGKKKVRVKTAKS
jgi:hypothetical protein